MAVTLHNTATIYFEQRQEAEKATALFWQAYIIFKQIGSPNAEVTAGYLSSHF